MKTFSPLFILFFISFLFENQLSFSQDTIKGGIVSGNWIKEKSPYFVKGNIVVPEDSSLVVNAGVTIKFLGSYSLTVRGNIELNGEIGDSILITANNTLIGWRGIRLVGKKTDTTVFKYCIIEYVKAPINYPESYFGAISIDSNYILKVSNSRISDNVKSYIGPGIQSTNSVLILQYNLFKNNNDGTQGGAIYSTGGTLIANNNLFLSNISNSYYSAGGGINSEFDSSVLIRDNLFSANSVDYSGGAISINNCNDVLIISNKFFKNVSGEDGGAIYIRNSKAKLINNLICNNTALLNGHYFSGGGGLKIYDSEVTIINNTIADNDNYGIFAAGSTIYLINSILSNISNPDYPYNAFVYDYDTEISSIYLTNNLIDGNLNSFYWYYSPQPIIKDTTNCVYETPIFLDRDNNMYQLDYNSPGYNAGTIDTTNLNLPQTDLDGNPRILDDTIDIGAYEFPNAIQNRIPKISSIPDYLIRPGDSLELSVDFTDADINDKHSIRIYTDNNNVQIKDLIDSVPGSTFKVISTAGLITNANITIVVEDNSGTVNSKDSINFIIHYSNSFNYTENQINHDMIWKTDTIKIFQNTQLNSEKALIIEPGTYVEFQGPFYLNILGQLIAEGSKSDPIFFDLKKGITDQYWEGINFPFDIHSSNYAPDEISSLKYCRIKNATVGLYLHHLNVIQVSNCDISHCIKAIICEGGATIKNSSIYENLILGLYLDDYNLGKLEVIGCKIFNNGTSGEGGGIRCEGDKIALIGNQIYDNKAKQGGGLYINGSVTLVNNTIVFNSSEDGGGIWQNSSSNSILLNNILQYNKAKINGNQIFTDYSLSNIYMYNNFIEDGIEGIYVSTSQFTPPVERFVNCSNNYSEYSAFVDTTSKDFSLVSSSICINAGLIDTTFLKYIDIKDLDGLRTNDDKIDIGAIEFIGTPDNRLPILDKTNTLFIKPDTTATISINYTELDYNDTTILQMIESSPHIEIQDIKLSNSTVSFNIKSNDTWKGSFKLIVNLYDKSDSIGESNTDTIEINVSNVHEFCGRYNKDVLWDADTILINCNVIIGKDATLTIKKGTVVDVNGEYFISIEGLLKAQGAINDSILFTCEDNNWLGVQIKQFNNLSKLKGEESFMKYCILEKTDDNSHYIAQAGLQIERSEFNLECSCIRNNTRTGVAIYYGGDIHPTIKNNLFNNNQNGALLIYGSPIVSGNIFEYNKPNLNYGYYPGALVIIGGSMVIENNIFRYNSGGAIDAGGHGINIYAKIQNNRIYSNTSESYNLSAGITCHDLQYDNHIEIIGNLIYNNNSSDFEGGGISLNVAEYNVVKINNNTIVKNNSTKAGGGVNLGRSSGATLNNNIIWGNSANGLKDQITFSYGSQTNWINNCVIEDGISGFTGYEPAINNAITSNIWETYPGFNNYNADDYSLISSSEFIDKGPSDTTGLHLPPTDIIGNPRISFTCVDIGAYESTEKTPANTIYVDLCMGDKYIFQDSVISKSGIYIFNYQNDPNNDSIIVIAVNINPVNEIELGNDTIINPNEYLSLSLNSKFQDILWFNGLTDSSIVVQGSPNETKKVWVRATNEYGCISSDTLTISFRYLSVNPNTAENQYFIYPNPTNSILNVMSQSDQLSIIHLNLYDIYGRIVYSAIYDEKDISLDLNNLSSGIYYLYLYNDKKVLIKEKIIKN